MHDAINRRTPDRPPLVRTNLCIHSPTDCLIPHQYSDLLFWGAALLERRTVRQSHYRTHCWTTVPATLMLAATSKSIRSIFCHRGDFVAGHCLDQVCAKIDVEGADDQVWEGLLPGLHRFRFVVMEILGPAVKRGLPLRIIQEWGVNAYNIHDYQLEHSAAEDSNTWRHSIIGYFAEKPPEQLKAC